MSETSAPELHAFAERLRLLLPPLLSTQRSSWEQGICAQALLECHRFLSGAGVDLGPGALAIPYDFVQWIYGLAHDSLVRQATDGRLSVLLNGDGASDAGALDPACMGEALYYLCSIEAQTTTLFPSPRGATSKCLLDGVGKMLDYVMHKCPRAPNSLLSHRTDATEIWSDTVYMLPPFLASAAAFYTLPLTHPLSAECPKPDTARALLNMALQQIILAADVLQSPAGEWSHIHDLESRTFKRVAFWGVGNGWVCCGIVRVLSTLVYNTTLMHAPHVDLRALGLNPTGDDELVPLLQRVYDILLRTLRACLPYALPSGLFPNVLGDPDAFPETNLAQMLAYTLYRLADLHAYSSRFRMLGLPGPEPGEGEEWVRRAGVLREAAVGMTDRWGFVRDVCGSPKFDSPGTAAEGQAWGVLMEVARAQYLLHKRLEERVLARRAV
ncbi:uncharacterized protein TRAVEDRAFT_120374 [Trametes versicolor FP-101664 SS1]|uniref:uncharacterized protein n=1 Tax=Trametes versicolor (strain FP-101664) TaxID=717944 RepID=UPI00046249D8|nr:uncharacterized protein TRAVEDRAFT_120374 [Trametes versicolor FP-101664 SS1]EIW60656.1 hypothetical protein TRAVEDRAFT_120374 [Trametes versicolor FP-101664 SS1]